MTILLLLLQIATEFVNGTEITHSDVWTASFSVQNAIIIDLQKLWIKTDADALLAQITTNPTDATDNADLSDLATTTSGVMVKALFCLSLLLEILLLVLL